ncbi:MAG: SpoIIE family protein phosphatase [Eubacteriales bacterium]|nr:SpoIIE family protein phosphatase [Eubacteriales bacterium]
MKINEKIKEKANGIKIKKQTIIWLRRAIRTAVSFALSFSSVFGGCSPFGVSMITASGKGEFLFSTVGAGLGYIIFCSPDNAVRYFSAVIISAVGTFAINMFKGKKDAGLPMLISFLSVLSTGFVMNVKSGAGAGEYALILGESILATGGSFFFFRAIHCNFKRLKLKALPVADLVCLAVTASVILSGLSFIEIKGVSPARIFAVLVILSTVRFGSQRWSLILSLCLGFALGISRENSLFLLGAYAFSALVSSLFTTFSSLGVGISFSVSMAFFAVAANMGSFSLCCGVESLIASIILALLPEVVTDKLSGMWQEGADIAPDGSLRQSLIVRLRLASSALAQVSENVRDVREKINKLGRFEPAESELRMVAADQFFSISDMLEDLAFEFDEAESFDFKTAGKIRRLLGEYDIYPENISVIEDKFGRQRIEILAPKDTLGLDSPVIRSEISKICKRDFEKGRLSVSSAGRLLSMMEKPNYKMSIGFAQYCAEGNLCGDTVKTINDSRGHMILIISDGMGKGSRAALDGAMGAGLLSKLLCAGFGFDSSLKVVNSALLVKSSEESLATLDCASVDLFTGKCEFYKAGAPASYIVKNGSITKCELSSMPAGILRGIEFAKRTAMLSAGDEIILMSDGITDTPTLMPEEFLSFEEDLSPNDKAKAILDFALKNSDSRHRDDMSVIVARLE